MQFATVECNQPSQDSNGYLQPLPLAKVYVYAAGTQTAAQLYDKSGNPIANPATADINGFGKFAAADGLYDIQIVSADGLYTAPLIEQVQFFDESNFAGVSALSSLGSSGFAVRTGSSGGISQFAARTISGGAGITVANGNGVAGNPTISLTDAGVTAAKLAGGAAAGNLGYSLDTDGTMAADSDAAVPSQKAVRTYIDAALTAADVGPTGTLVFAPRSAPDAPASGGTLYMDTDGIFKMIFSNGNIRELAAQS